MSVPRGRSKWSLNGQNDAFHPFATSNVLVARAGSTKGICLIVQDHPSRPQTPAVGRLDCAHVRRATLLLRQGPTERVARRLLTRSRVILQYWEYILPAEDNPGGGVGADQARGGAITCPPGPTVHPSTHENLFVLLPGGDSIRLQQEYPLRFPDQTGLGGTNSEEAEMSAKSWWSVVLTGAPRHARQRHRRQYTRNRGLRQQP